MLNKILILFIFLIKQLMIFFLFYINKKLLKKKILFFLFLNHIISDSMKNLVINITYNIL